MVAGTVNMILKKKHDKLGLSCAKLRANLVWLGLVWYRFATFDLFVFMFLAIWSVLKHFFF